MNFIPWMLSQGKSQSTCEKYDGAVRTSISGWAKTAGIHAGNLTSITTLAEWDRVAAQITKLPEFASNDTTGHKMYSNALKRYREYLVATAITSPSATPYAEPTTPADNETVAEADPLDEADAIERDLMSIERDAHLGETEKEALRKSRVGQGKFRDDLKDYWGSKCAVTGFANASCLIASHIKPWRDATNTERLDVANGLLLTPNLDKVFDRGLISFDDDGVILISKTLENPEILGITPTMKLRKIEARHRAYLAAHRVKHWFPA